MDIWNWVEEKTEELYDAGQYRLVEIIEELPGLVVDGEHDKADAIAPEGIALARRLNEKWVEVFLRHWHLQSTVLHRHMPSRSLAEAVSLLEFSHREDTRECPQSICAVQDLANCYACADGPGYFKQRIAVASETLERIDPSWPCYTCIASEYISALIDTGDYRQALTFLDKCDDELLKSNHKKDDGDLLYNRVDVLIRLGQFDKARKLLPKISGAYKGESFQLELRMLSALLEVMQGNFVQAKAALPEFDAINSGDYHRWFEVYYLLEKDNHTSQNSHADYLFSIAIAELRENGAVRHAVNLGFMAIELALARGRYFTAELHSLDVEELIPRLYQDLGASERLKEIRRAIAEARGSRQHTALFETVDELLSEIDREDHDSEHRLVLLDQHLDKWPDNEQLICKLSDVLCGLGKYHHSGRRLLLLLQKQADSPMALLEYGFLLLHNNIKGDLVAFCNEYQQQAASEEARMNLYWLLSLYHDRQAQHSEAVDYIRRILECKPDAFNARQRLARLNRDLHDYTAAAANLDYLIERHDDNDLKWDRIVIATLQQDWETARKLCAELEIELEGGEGEIDEDWEHIRVRLVNESGNQVNYLAKRTGPVTAVIKGISRIGGRQYYGDRIVFDPAPMNRLDRKDDEGNPMDEDGYYTRLYPAITCISEGNYNTYTLDGVHPGEAVLKDLLDRCEQQGIVADIRSSEEYLLTHQPTGEEESGIYVYLLVHQDRDIHEICEFVSEQVAGHDLVLIFPALARAANNRSLLEKFVEIADQYGLEEE